MTKVSPKIIQQTSRREDPSALRTPISRVRSNTIVCIVRSTTKKLMATPSMTNERIKGFSSGKLEELISVLYSAIERIL